MQNEAASAEASSKPSFDEALKVWLRIGLLSFGGPAGQIALMHKELVEKRKWIGEQQYLNALNFCMLLPGPEAMQLATYVGWRLHGVKGGLAAGLLFVLPGALMMLGLSMAYAAWGKLPLAEALLIGVKAVVLAVVVEALLRIARRALKTNYDWLLGAAAFLAIYLFAVPFPVIVLAALLIGFWRGRGGEPAGTAALELKDPRTVGTALLWLAIWVLPLLALALVFGSGHVLAQIGWFFSKLAMVTFGGAYAVLAYMREAVPKEYGWLSNLEMVDALGLAETTPGPLILVTQFVGFLGAFRAADGSYLMGTLGAVTTTWATFAPCFLWIFVGAPYVDRLSSDPRLKSALAAVTAAVVGVILNLTVTFAIDVLAPGSVETWLGPVRLYLPEMLRLSWPAVLLSIVAAVLTFRFHRDIIETLLVCAGLALLGFWLRPLAGF